MRRTYCAVLDDGAQLQALAVLVGQDARVELVSIDGGPVGVNVVGPADDELNPPHRWVGATSPLPAPGSSPAA